MNATLDRDEAPDGGLAEQFAALWRRKWLVLACALLGAVIAGGIAFTMPRQYEATVVMMPLADSTSGGQLAGLGSLASSFGGLASLAGLSIGDSARKQESVAVLQSEVLTEMYVQRNNLLPVLFYRKWNAQTHTWNVTDPKKVPTLWKANEFFKSHVRQINSNSKTGMVTMTITWEDAELAAKWANDLVRLTNEYMRNRAIQESERNINFLSEEATKTNLVEARQAVYSVLQTEINKEMLARGRDEYALKVVDPAVAPERAASPQKAVWVVVGALAGLLLGGGFVLMRADNG